MNGDFEPELGEVLRSIDTAEVLALFFPLLGRTLLVDARFDAMEGPLIKVVPMVGSVEERYKSIKRMRPRFPRPENITIIPWPRYIESLRRLGVWDHLVQRMVNSGQAGAVQACREAYQELLQLERSEVMGAIKGQGYHTLWERGMG